MPTTEAFKRYQATKARIDKQLKVIALQLMVHEIRAEGRPENWGFEADLHKVEADLNDIIEFLTSK